MKKMVLLLFILFILCACSNKTNDYKTLMEENDYVIIDVRTKEEYDQLHIVDAINIPHNEIDKNIEIDKEKIIFVYCKSGTRSKIAYNNLMNLGYEVYDLGAFSEIDMPKE